MYSIMLSGAEGYAVMTKRHCCIERDEWRFIPGCEQKHGGACCCTLWSIKETLTIYIAPCSIYFLLANHFRECSKFLYHHQTALIK
jgi:hypothetical protein